MLILAPLQGYTEVEFRRAWSRVFVGFDFAVSPFIPLAEGSRFRDRHLHDVLPNENKRMPVVPQVLGNDPQKFITLANRLQELGYTRMNWNLGCPKRTVARKKRGSGILHYPAMIRDILEQIIPQLPIKLSIKTRLGYESPEEFFKLIELYNDFPLESLMIHPRTGVQQYEGEMFLDTLDSTIDQIKHPIVFSGDIKDWQSYEDLAVRYPQIKDWMIGRGALSNPFLPEIILQKEGLDDLENLRTRLCNFHDELYFEIEAKFNHSRIILNKMKDYWSYFALWFRNTDEIFITLARLQSLNEFMELARRTLKENPLSPFYGRTNRQVKVTDGEH